MAEKPINITEVLSNAAKQYENESVFNRGKAAGITEVLNFLSTKNVTVTETVPDPEKPKPTK